MELSPEELQLAFELLQALEPEAQKGIVALIHVFHKKQLTAQDYLEQARQLLAQEAQVTPPTT